MAKVRYLREVYSPMDRKGKIGETKELPDKVAQRLKAEGFVEIIDDKKPTVQTGGKKE